LKGETKWLVRNKTPIRLKRLLFGWLTSQMEVAPMFGVANQMLTLTVRRLATKRLADRKFEVGDGVFVTPYLLNLLKGEHK
jgi:hypothetical protein